MRKFFLFTAIIVLFSACGKDTQHPIPNIPIYIEPILIYDPEYIALLDPYEMVTIPNEGYLGNGIIVINTGTDSNGDYQFVAYDATCPYDLKQGCAVSKDENSISLVVCSCCGSKFEVNYGAVNKGPASYPLKAYKTAFDGSYLRIYN